MILQGCRCDGDPVRCIKNAVRKWNCRIKPVPRKPDITILPVKTVNLHPINKSVTRTAANISKHGLPCAKRATCPQFQSADSPFNSRALAAVQLIGIIIKIFDQPLNQLRQGRRKCR